VIVSQARIPAIISSFPQDIMEAERINLIAKRLDDIGSRADELRRYL
jgi:tetrahydromethanopterin S-methyltransferase subunit G